MADEVRCSMCGSAPATDRYGLPVCRPCHDSLVSLDGDLAQMEADDPALRKIGDRVREAERELFAPLPYDPDRPEQEYVPGVGYRYLGTP